MSGQKDNPAQASRLCTRDHDHLTFSKFLEESSTFKFLSILMQNGEEDTEKAALYGNEFERLSCKCSVKLSEIPGSSHESYITV